MWKEPKLDKNVGERPLTQCRLPRPEIGAREKFCGVGSFDYYMTIEHFNYRLQVVVITSVQVIGEIFGNCSIRLQTCLRF